MFLILFLNAVSLFLFISSITLLVSGVAIASRSFLCLNFQIKPIIPDLKCLKNKL